MNDFINELWNTQFGFFYYNDHEIFNASQKELEQRAQEYADTGINHVITFSVTHFRWSFQSNWEDIDSALKKIVNAFHKFSIKVTEHHSANFIFSLNNNEGLEHIKTRFTCRNSSITNWSGFNDDLNINRNAGNGITIKSLLQVEGETAMPIYLEGYGARLMCPNNPDFVKLYLEYLENHIYPTGIDGIMTDDISNRCACHHCRKLFTKQTGFNLPECGSDWVEWEQNTNTPSYIAWLKFRLESCNNFDLAVKKHYESLGLRMRRPNYISTAVSFTYFHCLQDFDNLPALDWAFQENNFSDIIRYSWPEWLVEAGHRRMVAANRKIPAMSMFYPDREDTTRFGWALAMSWGEKYLATTHNASVNQNLFEKPLRKFEKQHSLILNKADSIATLAFYDSYDNRIIYNGYNSRSAPLLSGWIQACAHNNIPWKMINNAELNNLNSYDAIVLPEVAYLKENEIIALLNFAKKGGNLIVIGDCGTMNSDGSKHNSPFEDNIPNIIVLKRESVTLAVEKRATIHSRWNKSGYESRITADDWHFLTNSEKRKRNDIIHILKKAMPKGFGLEVEKVTEDLLASAYIAENQKIAIHLTNAHNTLMMPDTNTIGHSDPIPFPEIINPVIIRLTKPYKYSKLTIKQCMLHIPAPNRTIPLEYFEDKKVISITIPKKSFSFYGLIEISF